MDRNVFKLFGAILMHNTKNDPIICNSGIAFFKGMFDAGVTLDRLKTAIYNPITNECIENPGGDLIDGLVYGFVVIPPPPEPEPKAPSTPETMSPPFEFPDERELIVFDPVKDWKAAPSFKSKIDPRKIKQILKRYKVELEFLRLAEDDNFPINLEDFNILRKRMVTSEIWVLRFYRSKTLQEFESGEYGNRTQKLVDLFAKEGVTISTDGHWSDEWYFDLECGDESTQQYLCRSLFQLGVAMRWGGTV